MSETAKTVVRLYYQPQSLPCGPNSSCCGPVGQDEWEMLGYSTELEHRVQGIKVEVVDASQRLNLGRDLPVIKLLNTFGAAACPIFTVNDEVVSMGPPAMDELVTLVREKISFPAGARA